MHVRTRGDQREERLCTQLGSESTGKQRREVTQKIEWEYMSITPSMQLIGQGKTEEEGASGGAEEPVKPSRS